MLGGMAATAVMIVAQAPVYEPKPVGNLKQVMRSIPYPNSEIIYAVQTKAPANAEEWKTVENASIAIAETANLITMAGRLREDGKPVPVAKADWNKYAAGLAAAGQVCYKAAAAKDREAVNKCTDGLSEACSNCHDVYRDAPPPAAAKR
jgi:cytochrome c556